MVSKKPLDSSGARGQDSPRGQCPLYTGHSPYLKEGQSFFRPYLTPLGWSQRVFGV